MKLTDAQKALLMRHAGRKFPTITLQPDDYATAAEIESLGLVLTVHADDVPGIGDVHVQLLNAEGRVLLKELLK